MTAYRITANTLPNGAKAHQFLVGTITQLVRPLSADCMELRGSCDGVVCNQAVYLDQCEPLGALESLKEGQVVAVSALGVATVLSGYSRVVSTDFTALEARVAAHLSGACDLHRSKAAELFGVAPEHVTHEQRQAGKRANFMEWYTPSVSMMLRAQGVGVQP